ncbi:hypothetical protein PTMSG1_04450 [Pyrenophora teres f. maculata]|nr:hypothetical protein PTMSG1_04450 [Pyrenophora teres f. maculata]
MSLPLEYYQHTPSPRPQRQKYHSPESFLSFLDESWDGDHERHVVLARKTPAVEQQRPLYDSALESPVYEMEFDPVVEDDSFLYLVMLYMFRVVIAAIVICFLTQTPIGIPTILLFFLAIPSLYFYITSAESTSRGYTNAYEPEVLHRDESPEYLLRDSPEGTPVDNAEPPPHEPAEPPGRTFTEAISDTVPRMISGFYAFVLSVWHFEVTIELRHLVFLHIVRQLIDYGAVVAFYRDWFVLVCGLLWSNALKPLVESVLFVFGQSTRPVHEQNAGHRSIDEVPRITVPAATPNQLRYWQR